MRNKGATAAIDSGNANVVRDIVHYHSRPLGRVECAGKGKLSTWLTRIRIFTQSKAIAMRSGQKNARGSLRNAEFIRRKGFRRGGVLVRAGVGADRQRGAYIWVGERRLLYRRGRLPGSITDYSVSRSDIDSP